MMEFIFLIIGLGALWLGSEFTISGALNIAERHKISHLFIGLTILALGTDLPELFIDVNAAIDRLQGIETSGLIIGETIGTTLVQISLILGITTLFGTLLITKRELVRDGIMMIVSVLFIFIVGLDGEISRGEGVIFILTYIFYFITLFREEQLFEKIKKAPPWNFVWAILSMIGGFIFLIIGSDLTVENALILSEKWGMAQYAIGLLIVGLGTSLPELATSITAIRKKAGTMAVGNIIGSNIFDTLFTLGIGSAISGFLFEKQILYFDVPVLFIVSILALFLFKKTMHLGRKQGMILIAVYGLYFIVRLSGFFII
jgi:cation:H+ antiporter